LPSSEGYIYSPRFPALAPDCRIRSAVTDGSQPTSPPATTMERYSQDMTRRMSQPRPIPMHHHRSDHPAHHSPLLDRQAHFPPTSSPQHSNPSLSPESSPTHSVTQHSKRRRVPQEERKRTAMSCDRCKSRKIKVLTRPLSVHLALPDLLSS
jgi:hypothetical protein